MLKIITIHKVVANTHHCLLKQPFPGEKKKKERKNSIIIGKASFERITVFGIADTLPLIWF